MFEQVFTVCIVPVVGDDISFLEQLSDLGATVWIYSSLLSLLRRIR